MVRRLALSFIRKHASSSHSSRTEAGDSRQALTAAGPGQMVEAIAPERGGCGSSPGDNSEKDISCDACSKKKINLCESDDSTGLAAVSNVATWGRFEKRAPGFSEKNSPEDEAS